VIVIFDATDKEYAKFLLEGVKNKLEEEFNE